MTDDAHMLAYCAVLAWLMIMTAALVRANGSLILMFGNRDDLPPSTPIADRADRAAKNMLENLVLFTAVWAATKGAGVGGWKVTHGAQVFFGARLVYFPLYLAGVKVVRTLAWFTGFAGIALLAWATIAA